MFRDFPLANSWRERFQDLFAPPETFKPRESENQKHSQTQ